ncbi:MAG TPA: hypothetical protein VGY99_29110 [Candidatus Binataceae bacterium]|jgi:hypothetical protein|nr:hypothetical protein [Candidatus Binataceae bacterium]
MDDENLVTIIRDMSVAWQNVIALYGGAMCSAQILEGELVQILYYLRIAEGELKTESDHSWAYTQMERLKPGELLEQIRKKGVKSDSI